MDNRQIHFHPGMSILEFLRRFGTEAQCVEAVNLARRPDGFRCPRCAVAEHHVVGHGARELFQCAGCRRQAWLTAGSLIDRAKVPLTTWFLGTYLISQAKTGLSALALKRQLGVNCPAAWLLHQRINRAMAHQDSTHRLGGTVQLDDAYLGGERAGDKAGRGSENKVPFVAAVWVEGKGHPLYVKLNLVSGVTSQAIAQWAEAGLMPGTRVTSDALGCFAAMADAGCIHLPTVVGGVLPRALPEFKWVGTVLGDLKTTLAGVPRAQTPRVRRTLPGRLRLSLQSALRSVWPRRKPHRGRSAHEADQGKGGGGSELMLRHVAN